MTEIRELLDQLDQAHAAATPGPWKVRDDGVTVEIEGCDRESVRDKHGFHDADAALIVAAVNALPRLAAAVRAVEALTDELEREAFGDGKGTIHAAGALYANRLRSALAAALTEGTTP